MFWVILFLRYAYKYSKETSIPVKSMRHLRLNIAKDVMLTESNTELRDIKWCDWQHFDCVWYVSGNIPLGIPAVSAKTSDFHLSQEESGLSLNIQDESKNSDYQVQLDVEKVCSISLRWKKETLFNYHHHYYVDLKVHTISAHIYLEHKVWHVSLTR